MGLDRPRAGNGKLELLQLIVGGIAQGCVYGLVALGFVLIYKATEMVNFAQGDLMMLGAFVALTLVGTMGVNYWLGFLLAALIMAVFGYLLGDAAGKDLTRAKFLAALEAISDYKPLFPGPSLSYGPDKHQGSTATFLAKVESGRWKVIAENLLY